MKKASIDSSELSPFVPRCRNPEFKHNEIRHKIVIMMPANFPIIIIPEVKNSQKYKYFKM